MSFLNSLYYGISLFDFTMAFYFLIGILCQIFVGKMKKLEGGVQNTEEVPAPEGMIPSYIQIKGSFKLTSAVLSSFFIGKGMLFLCLGNKTLV